MQIGSLFMALGFDVDDKKLGEFDGKIKALRGGITGLAGVAAAGVGALGAMAISGAKSTLQMSNLSMQTMQTTDDIQRLANVASGVNPFLTWEQSLGMISSVYDTLVDVEWGQGATGSLLMMGADAMAQNSVKDMIGELRRAYHENPQNLSHGRMVRLMGEGGLPKDFIGMVTASQGRYDELMGREIKTEEQIKNYNDLSFAMEEASHQAGVLSGKLGAEFAPAASKFFEVIGDSIEWVMNDGVTAAKDLKDWSHQTEDDIGLFFTNLMPNIREANENLGDDVAEWYGEMMSGIKNTNERLGLDKIRTDNPDRYNQLMQDRYLKNRGVVNNINIESTADAQDLVESVFNEIESRADRDLIGELPNTSLGGIR